MLFYSLTDQHVIMPKFVILLPTEQETNTQTSIGLYCRPSILAVCQINGFVWTLQVAFDEDSHKYSSWSPQTQTF